MQAICKASFVMKGKKSLNSVTQSKDRRRTSIYLTQRRSLFNNFPSSQSSLQRVGSGAGQAEPKLPPKENERKKLNSGSQFAAAASSSSNDEGKNCCEDKFLKRP